MGMIHKKSRTTGKRPRRTGEKVAQNTGIDFLALRLGVVLSLPKRNRWERSFRKWCGFVDFGWRGFDLDFFRLGKKGSKKTTPNPRQFPEQNPRCCLRKSVPKSVLQNQKSTASSHPSSLCACSSRCSELSDWKDPRQVPSVCRGRVG